MALSTQQVALIKATVPVLIEHGDAITKCFYKNLLEAHPELWNIFNRTDQTTGKQPRALAGALYAYAANIDNLTALSSAVERICEKHVSLFIRPEQYDVVGKHLLEAMGQVLTSALTPEILDAWAAAYRQLAELMIDTERRLYEADGDWQDWRDFKITCKVKESSEITSFYLKPVDDKPLPSFKPGQYVSVRTFVPELQYQQARQYSLSDKPSPEYYRISVKCETGLDMTRPESLNHPGYISNVLHNQKKEGDILQVSHPHGEFFLDPLNADSASPAPVVLLSAGVGLTPLMSMLNALLSHETKRPISWIHGARSTLSQAFASYVRDVCSGNLHVHSNIFIANPSPSEEKGAGFDFGGQVDLTKLDQTKHVFLSHPYAQYYICGPSKFMTDMSKYLTDQGVQESRIKYELFGTGTLSKL